MNGVQLALALFKLVNYLFQLAQEQRWYKAGMEAANAAANEEQRRRIEEARAAARDVDELGGLHDPHNRDRG